MQGRLKQPAPFSGQGGTHIGRSTIGVWPPPFFLSGYTHIEAQQVTAKIVIGANSHLNNNAVQIAERSSIGIGDNTLIGHNLSVCDFDFHCLEPSLRSLGLHQSRAVSTGSKGFIGAGVTMLKGASIGDNSVIVNGSIVNSDIPANLIAGDILALVLRTLETPGATARRNGLSPPAWPPARENGLGHARSCDSRSARATARITHGPAFYPRVHI